jgi:uncharacterized protein YjbI with pentapeptide repeats
MSDFTREEIEEVLKASRKLERAELRDIDLSEADLRGADLSAAYLGGATYDKKTEFPDEFDPEAAGMALVE